MQFRSRGNLINLGSLSDPLFYVETWQTLYNQVSHAVLKVLKKYWFSTLVFKTLKKYWIWPKY